MTDGDIGWLVLQPIHGRISTRSRRLRDPAENTPAAERLAVATAVARQKET